MCSMWQFELHPIKHVFKKEINNEAQNRMTLNCISSFLLIKIIPQGCLGRFYCNESDRGENCMWYDDCTGVFD